MYGLPVPPEQWQSFAPGDRVFVRRGLDTEVTGVIDMIANDSSVFWVWGEAGRGRIALHIKDDASVWRV